MLQFVIAKMSNQSSVERLVDQALQGSSGPLYTAMQLLVQDVYRGYDLLFPAAIESQILSIGEVFNPNPDVDTLVVLPQQENVHLVWSLTGTSSLYEVRYEFTSSMQALVPVQPDWDNATFLLQTHSLQADISPYTIPFLYGSYTFLLKSIGTDGKYSQNFITASLTIPRIQRPTITATTIGNNVLLKWTEPASVFRINHYNVFSNGTLVGTVKATFDVIFEQVGGDYAFTVEAVDIIGNIGLPATDVQVTLGNPTDFSHFADFTSTLNGTRTNVAIDLDGSLFAPDTSDDYEHHFTDNGYATWQDPINAGFPLYFEPSDVLVGTYEETAVDLGSIIPNTIVSVDYNTTRAVGSVNITCQISVSNDNITYDAYVAGFSRFVASVRYVKFKLTFTAADNKSSVNVFNVRVVGSVRRESDGGVVTVSGAAGGTHVTYNKTFLSMDSITLTVQQNIAYFAVYVFDTPATAGFTIHVYDSGGALQGATVTWVARGVIA